MAGESEKDLKAKFLKAYSNLPEEVREDVLVVIEEKPFSWNAATIAVKNDTPTGKKILKTLQKLGVL